MHISEIHIYPIKSLKGIRLDSAVVEKRGLRHDRRWMLVDAENRFMTQREFPQMARVTVSIQENHLEIHAAEMTSIFVPFIPTGNERVRTMVWGSDCEGIGYSSEVDEWFSRAIGAKCRLIYMPDDEFRPVNSRFNAGDDIVSFADGYPLLAIGEASLRDLNSRMPDAPVEMRRFRPNLVIAGSEAFAEDKWADINIGDAGFRAAKPCARCVMTTIDPDLGEFDGKEPLKTLATYRRAKQVFPDRYESNGHGPNDVLFGMNLIPINAGVEIKVRDKVIINTGDK